jgi:hypothetical protein
MELGLVILWGPKGKTTLSTPGMMCVREQVGRQKEVPWPAKLTTFRLGKDGHGMENREREARG